MNKLYLTAIPSLSMIISALFLNFNKSIQNSMLAFTSGLLLVSCITLFPELIKNKRSLIYGFMGIVFSISCIYLTSEILEQSSVLSALYFDSLSDGFLLGVLVKTLKNINLFLFILASMSIEMMITAYSSVSLLENSKLHNSRRNVSFAGVILFLFSIIGYYLVNFINEKAVIGFGIGSMLWLSIAEFIPKLQKTFTSIVYLAVGIIFGLII
jgi:hypothetical protein